MNNRIKNCKICDSKLIVYTETFYGGIVKKGIKRRKVTTSQDGIMFGNSWFCNQCWNILIKQNIYKPIILNYNSSKNKK